MSIELLFLLLAWAATFSLIVVLPWAVIRLTVGVLETDVSKSEADDEHAQPRHVPDAAPRTPLSQESDEAVEAIDGVESVSDPPDGRDVY